MAAVLWRRTVVCRTFGAMLLALAAAAAPVMAAQEYPAGGGYGWDGGLSISFLTAGLVRVTADPSEPEDGTDSPDWDGDEEDGDDGESPQEGSVTSRLTFAQDVAGWAAVSRDNFSLRLSGNLEAAARVVGGGTGEGSGDSGGASLPCGTLSARGGARLRLTVPGMGRVAAECSASSAEEYGGKHDPTTRLTASVQFSPERGMLSSLRIRDEWVWHPEDFSRMNETRSVEAEFGQELSHGGPVELGARADIVVGQKRYPLSGLWDADWWETRVGSTAAWGRMEVSGEYLLRSRGYLDEGRQGSSYVTRAFKTQASAGPFTLWPVLGEASCVVRADVAGYDKEERDGDRVVSRSAGAELALTPPPRGRPGDPAWSRSSARWGVLTRVGVDLSASTKESWDASEAALVRTGALRIRGSAALRGAGRSPTWTGDVAAGWQASRVLGGGWVKPAEDYGWLEGRYRWRVTGDTEIRVALRWAWWGGGRPHPGGLKEVKADLCLVRSLL